jgi:hypothetical protein
MLEIILGVRACLKVSIVIFSIDRQVIMLRFSTKARQVCFRTVEESQDKMCTDWIKVIDIAITGVLNLRTLSGFIYTACYHPCVIFPASSKRRSKSDAGVVLPASWKRRC